MKQNVRWLMTAVLSVICMQVDIITQTETLYELTDERDHTVLREALNPGARDSAMLHPSAPPPPSASSSSSSSRHQSTGVLSFVCRMNTAARSVRYAPAPIKTGFERFRASSLQFCQLNIGKRYSTVARGHDKKVKKQSTKLCFSLFAHCLYPP